MPIKELSATNLIFTFGIGSFKISLCVLNEIECTNI